MATKRGLFRLPTAVIFFMAASVAVYAAPILLDVDATDAPRNLLHARLHIPAMPGKLTLFYPKWIPGEHMPSGPVNDVAGLVFTANGKTLAWQRDAEDMFAFHLDVPAGANAVDVSLDFLLAPGGGAYSSGSSSTARLLDLSWNQVLLYPQTAESLKTPFVATLQLPAGWQYGTALPVANLSKTRIQFAPAPLGTLIDSPVIAGEYFETVDLAPGEKVPCFIHIAADNAADLATVPPDTEHFPRTARLVKEANVLFGAHHYRDYHFLLTLSDRVAHFGLDKEETEGCRGSRRYSRRAARRR